MKKLRLKRNNLFKVMELVLELGIQLQECLTLEPGLVLPYPTIFPTSVC
jgi:hypothetical protein